MDPAEEDVARRLHHPLTDDHPLGVVLVHAPADVLLEHRLLGLLQLQEQRIAAVATEEQRDPRPRPDAADADDLPREVGQLELLEQLAPVVVERLAIDPDQRAQPVERLLALVPGKEHAERHDQRRLVDDLGLAVDLLA